MSFPATVFLGVIAGGTICLGLPLARLRRLPYSWQAFFTAVATGILVFLFWDVVTEATEPISAELAVARQGQPASFILLLALFAGGFGVGLLSLVYFEARFIHRASRDTKAGDATPTQLALTIAAGIGLHNFAEGLAIGQASRSGAIGLATVLLIGFGLHNATEGFGIAAPLAGGPRPTWTFLGLAGLIGGGPTFLGTILGYAVQAQPIFVLCLALAAGSIFYVVVELLYVGRRFAPRELAMWGVILGFLTCYGTDLILTWGGA